MNNNNNNNNNNNDDDDDNDDDDMPVDNTHYNEVISCRGHTYKSVSYTHLTLPTNREV